MQNKDIREEVNKANLKLWEVAYKLGINDGNFSRKLRFELSKEEKNKIRKIIQELKAEKLAAEQELNEQKNKESK